MKTIISKYYKFTAIAAFALGMELTTSCSDFLDQPSQTAIEAEQVFSNATSTDYYVQSLYSSWKENYRDEPAWFLLIGTDEIQIGAQQTRESHGATEGAWDFNNGYLNPENSYIEWMWNNRMKVAAQCGMAIKTLDEMTGQTTELINLTGELKFIRGFNNYQSAMLWGRIPVSDGTEDTSRKDLKTVWESIIQDFEDASKQAPEACVTGRANRYAAMTMLGKAYMSAPEETGLRDFTKAAEAFKAVINSGKYQLDPSFEDLFAYDTKNASQEVIMAHTYSNARGYANQIQFQIGSRAAQNFFSDNCYFSGYDHAVATKYAYLYKEDGGVWTKGDKRYDVSLRSDFSRQCTQEDFDNIIANYPSFIKELTSAEMDAHRANIYEYMKNTKAEDIPVFVDKANRIVYPNYMATISWEGLGEDYDELLPHIRKYEDFRTDDASGMSINNMWLSGKDVPVLRYADVLLSYGECCMHTGSGDGLKYYNEVRSRAGLDAVTSLTEDEIMDERMREFFGENWRRFDLIRTGKWETYMKARNKWTKMYNEKGMFVATNKLFPIPQTELNQNTLMRTSDGSFDQNPGY